MTTYRNCLQCTAEIVHLYEQYAELPRDNPNIKICIDDDLNKIRRAIESGNYFVANLCVELPLDQIKQTFERDHVIQLRPIGDSKNILLGCGSNPVDPHYVQKLDEDHSHPGMVTVNPQLSMNPTIVAAFGDDDGLNDLLPKNHFENLYGEAVNIGERVSDFMKSDTARRALQCLTSNFKTYEVGDETPFQSFGSSNFFWKSEDL